MKKILLSAAAIASMLFAASCQKENFSASQQEGDVVTATITVQAPGQPATKAIGDGMTADNLVFAVFDETGAELPELRQGDWTKGQPEITFGGDLQTTVTVTLVRGKEYTFVCWAQNDEATCYDFTDMKNIGISYKDANGDNFVAQDEKRDAFYAAVASEKVTQNFTQTIELTRPFAQVNVGSADIVEAHNAGLEVENLYSTMTLTNVATSLNTFSGAKAGEAGNTDGKVSGVETVTFELAPAISKSEFDGTNAAADHEWLYVNTPGYENNVYGWLAMNYILVNDGAADGTGSVDGTEKSLTDVSFAIYEGEGLQLCSYDVPNVPVQRNYRSHILGSLLTAQGEITVVIEPAFEEPDYVVNVWDGYSVSEPQKDAEGNYLVTKPEELAWFQKNAPTANIYLVNDIDLAGQVWTPIEYFNGEKPFTFEGKAITKSGETYPTIYGLNIEQTSGKAAGLFGGVTFNFKNFTIDGAKCNCVSSFVGAVAGQLYGNLENVHVKNVEFVADPSRKDIRYGAIVGMHNSGNATGCSVDNAVVKAFHNVGGISGTLNESNNNRTYSNCTVKNSTFEAYCTEGAGASMVGALTGNANGVILYYEDCVAEGNNVNVFAGYGTSVDLKVPVLNVDNTEFAVACDASKVEINIESNIAWTVAGKGVTATPAEGEGNGTVVLEFGANETYEEVVYTVTVASEAEVEPVVITITQEAAEPEFMAVTVAEFLAAAEDETMYELTGVITSVTNTTYGNFYLKDATGEVLIYGLCSPEGEQKYWAASGAKVGDTITVQTVRTSYNGTAQGKNALFVELVPFVAQASEWGVVGDLNNWGGTKDIVMYTTWHTENLFVAYNVEIASGSFKIRANNAWDDTKNYGFEVAGSVNADNYYAVITRGDSQNITPMVYGKYDVYFDLTNKRVALMTPGTAYAEAKDGGKPIVVVAGLKDHEWGVVGSFNNWAVDNYVVTVVEGDWAVAKNVTLAKNDQFKFAADKAWTLSYGSACDVNVGKTYTTYNNGGNMKFVGEAGAYDIYFSLTTADFYMEQHVEKTELAPFTSNVTWTVNSNNKSYSEKATVNGQSNISVLKLGTSSVVGSATYKIPAGTKKIGFYGVAWNGKAGKLKVTNGTTELYNGSLKSNTGAANNTPYTMTVSEDDYYEIVLDSAVTEETTIKVETLSSATRVVLFGINTYTK